MAYRYLNEMRMDELTSPDKYILFLPIGISEGHGKHLPIGTDTIQTEYVTEKVAKVLDRESIIAPVLNYGHCKATEHLPGTFSISFDSLRFTVRDILKAALNQGFNKIVIISGHSGKSHMMALRLAAEEVLESSDAEILLLSDYDFAYELKGEDIPENDGHGGQIETSRVLAIREDLVGDERPEKKIEYPRFKILVDYSDYLSEGMRGDSKASSKEEGKRTNEYVIEGIVKEIEKTF